MREQVGNTLCPCLVLLAAIGCTEAGSAHADGPSFDRPGIAFSTGTMPAGTWTIEQGLPDWQRSDEDGVVSTQASAAAICATA